MTDQKFINQVYTYFSEFKACHPKPKFDDNELLWLAAMRCALTVNPAAVRAYCKLEKPATLGGQQLYEYQFNSYRRIALANNNISEVELKQVLNQFSLRKKKENKK